MGSFCRKGGAEEEGGVGFRVSGFGVREEYPGGRAWGEAGVEGRTGKLDEMVSTWTTTDELGFCWRGNGGILGFWWRAGISVGVGCWRGQKRGRRRVLVCRWSSVV